MVSVTCSGNNPSSTGIQYNNVIEHEQAREHATVLLFCTLKSEDSIR